MNNGFTFTYNHPYSVSKVTVEAHEDATLVQLEYVIASFLKASGYEVVGVTIELPCKAIG